MKLEIETLGYEKLMSDLSAIASTRRKKRVIVGLTRYVLALNRRRIREQKNTDGSSFEPKKRKKSPSEKALKKILTNSSKKKRKSVSLRYGENTGTIISNVPFAREHQLGVIKTEKAWTAKDFEKKKTREKKRGNGEGEEFTSNQTSLEASTSQAKYMRENWGDIWKRVDLDHRPKGKTGRKRTKTKRKKWTLKKIRKAYTMSQAGYIIKSYRLALGRRPKTQWKINLPKREVLGLSRQDIQKTFVRLRELITDKASVGR